MRAHWKEEGSQAGKGPWEQLVAQLDELYFTIQILTKKYFTAMYQAGGHGSHHQRQARLCLHLQLIQTLLCGQSWNFVKIMGDMWSFIIPT